MLKFTKSSHLGLCLLTVLCSFIIYTPEVKAQFGRCVPWCPEDGPSIPNPGGFTGYKTNKFDLKSQVEGGGWVVSWSDDISETDAAQGLVAGGVSIYSANPGPFIAWSEYLVDRTLNSLSRNLSSNARNEAERILRSVVNQAIRGRSPKSILRNFDTLDFKAGAIRYSGANYALGRVVSRTWGLKPYVAFRIRSSSPSTSSSSSSNFDSIYFLNKCNRKIQTAIRYKDLRGNWTTGGWWTLNRGEKAFVAKTSNSIFYTYAESIDPASKRLYWSNNDSYYHIRNSSKKYGFSKKKIRTDEWGSWTESFTCN